MGKRPHTSSTNNKKPSSPGPLQKHFQGSAKQKKHNSKGSPKKENVEKAEKAEQQEVPTRQQHSGFLTYLKVVVNSKSPEAASQAEAVQRHYFSLSPAEKHQVILAFFRAGGKKPGLVTCFQQVVRVSSKTSESHWEGYATFGKLCEIHQVQETN